MSDGIRPFKINVPQSAIDTLKEKLALATFPDEVDFSDDWNYGVPRSDIKRLAEYWKDGFDWRAQEEKLNQFPQFTTGVAVDGFGDHEIHFLHQKSSKPDSIPLLFCHGWPGSFLEALKILPLLTESQDGPSFHVVAPSLPNFGFSEGVKKKGFSIPQYAESLHKLMAKLGYTKYVTQGGDWGFIITRLLGVKYPESCLASHLNFVRVTAPPSLSKSPLQYIKHALLPYTDYEKAGLARSTWFRHQGFGYNLEQSTKPSTLGFALSDSPVAVLAWIYEKLHDWTDNYPWTDDEILTWISVYQFSTAGPEASIRIYYEATHAEVEEVAKGVVYVPGVPIGLSYFPKDLVVPPKTWGRTLGPVVFEQSHPDGGHFAAHERPKELVDDLRRMFGKGGGAHAVVAKAQSKL
ncbi:Alpha/Beta hydrolase protein [Ilyonectria destructans]|nr:Alpha/Beta hydrolase protein [Ilyonectria destructans]